MGQTDPERYSTGVLVSHRHHTPPLDGTQIELDRVIGRHCVLRRVSMRGVIQDERVMVAPAPERRSRLLTVFSGRLLAFANGRAREIGPGEMIAVERLTELRIRGAGHTFEIDWDPNSVAGRTTNTAFELGRLGASSLAALETLSSTVAALRVDEPAGLEIALERAIDALAAEGLPLAADDVAAALGPHSTDEQATWSAIDRALCRLDESPDVEDVVGYLGSNRRTLARRLSRLDRQYRIYGDAGVEWRAQRDTYRLLVGSIFLSHPDATTNGVARLLGYRSPEALCHAFANAGLPSPGAIREAG